MKRQQKIKDLQAQIETGSLMTVGFSDKDEREELAQLQKELDEEKVSENTAIGGNLAGVVANRPDIIEPLPNNIETKGDVVQLQPFKGTLKAGEKIRNIDGKSFVVPAGG